MTMIDDPPPSVLSDRQMEEIYRKEDIYTERLNRAIGRSVSQRDQINKHIHPWRVGFERHQMR